MLKLLVLCFVVFAFEVQIFANLSSKNVDFITYYRAGVGSNGRGGDQNCFSQQGTPGNEFRLGNECSSYGELGFAAYVKRPTEENPLYGFGKILYAYEPAGHTNWEGANGTNPIAIRESFAEVGGVGDYRLSFWAGKRFYRGPDVHINDFYYFADTSGNGVGVGNIPFFFKGKLHFAVMRETSSTESDKGRLNKTLLDFRAKGIDLGGNFQLEFWLGHMMSTGGTVSGTPTQEYDDPTGQVYSFILHKGFSKGFQQFAVMYGKGLMDEFNLYGDVTAIKNSAAAKAQRKSHRLRIVEQFTYDFTPKFSLHFASTLELRDNGESSNSKELWWNVGARPVYFFNDNYQLVGEFGTSVVDPDGGSPRRLTRLTIAPQISLSRNVWSRPVVRFFYSRSFWSRSNRGVIATTGPYARATAGTNIGAQVEVWF